MGALRDVHILEWQMKLADGGYTCFELVDGNGRRWGWLVNAGATGWAAHVGDFGQAAALGLPAVPLDKEVQHCDSAADGRAWVEESVAAGWKEIGQIEAPRPGTAPATRPASLPSGGLPALPAG